MPTEKARTKKERKKRKRGNQLGKLDKDNIGRKEKGNSAV
jgi:hypothetical protein